jgi:hypothetical protein
MVLIVLSIHVLLNVSFAGKASVDNALFVLLLCCAAVGTGFRSTRRTKLVCTIGPSSCSYEVLSELAQVR